MRMVMILAFLVFTLVLLAGCGQGPGVPAEGSAPLGITYEEEVRDTPPCPQNLRADIADSQRVILTWDPPPPVTVRHYYSDTISYYKVYRSQDGEDYALIDTASGTSYTDEGVSVPLTPGITYRYFVTAVHEGRVESARSDTAFLPASSAPE